MLRTLALLVGSIPLVATPSLAQDAPTPDPEDPSAGAPRTGVAVHATLGVPLPDFRFSRSPVPYRPEGMTDHETDAQGRFEYTARPGEASEFCWYTTSTWTDHWAGRVDSPPPRGEWVVPFDLGPRLWVTTPAGGSQTRTSSEPRPEWTGYWAVEALGREGIGNWIGLGRARAGDQDLWLPRLDALREPFRLVLYDGDHVQLGTTDWTWLDEVGEEPLPFLPAAEPAPRPDPGAPMHPELSAEEVGALRPLEPVAVEVFVHEADLPHAVLLPLELVDGEDAKLVMLNPWDWAIEYFSGRNLLNLHAHAHRLREFPEPRFPWLRNSDVEPTTSVRATAGVHCDRSSTHVLPHTRFSGTCHVLPGTWPLVQAEDGDWTHRVERFTDETGTRRVRIHLRRNREGLRFRIPAPWTRYPVGEEVHVSSRALDGAGEVPLTQALDERLNASFDPSRRSFQWAVSDPCGFGAWGDHRDFVREPDGTWSAEVRFDEPVPLLVRVVDAAGAPVPGAAVHVLDRRVATTDADGRAVLARQAHGCPFTVEARGLRVPTGDVRTERDGPFVTVTLAPLPPILAGAR